MGINNQLNRSKCWLKPGALHGEFSRADFEEIPLPDLEQQAWFVGRVPAFKFYNLRSNRLAWSYYALVFRREHLSGRDKRGRDRYFWRFELVFMHSLDQHLFDYIKGVTHGLSYFHNRTFEVGSEGCCGEHLQDLYQRREILFKLDAQASETLTSLAILRTLRAFRDHVEDENLLVWLNYLVRNYRLGTAEDWPSKSAYRAAKCKQGAK